jgi:hypothetical protein
VNQQQKCLFGKYWGCFRLPVKAAEIGDPTGIANGIQDIDIVENIVNDFVIYHQMYPHAV